jgi:hypothetical protein
MKKLISFLLILNFLKEYSGAVKDEIKITLKPKVANSDNDENNISEENARLFQNFLDKGPINLSNKNININGECHEIENMIIRDKPHSNGSGSTNSQSKEPSKIKADEEETKLDLDNKIAKIVSYIKDDSTEILADDGNGLIFVKQSSDKSKKIPPSSPVHDNKNIADPEPVVINHGIKTGRSFDYSRYDECDLVSEDDNGKNDKQDYQEDAYLNIESNTSDIGNNFDSETVSTRPNKDDETEQIKPPKSGIIPDETLIPSKLPENKENKSDDKSAGASALMDMSGNNLELNLTGSNNVIPSISSLFPGNQEEENVVESIDSMKNVLSNLQKILLYLAGVTLLAILLYSVYYINLIRLIYAKKVSGCKNRRGSRSLESNDL